jgi:TetR/AcrR family transcriptional regulator, fatty acid metabolism regulator protein
VRAKDVTRDRILRSALDVFADKGYHRAAVDDIVRASGTSKGAVYHHFATKEAIFVALVDDFSVRLQTAVTTAIAAHQGALGKVQNALHAVLETFGENRQLARLVLVEAMSLGPTYEAKRAEIHARFGALIQGYLDEAVGEGAIAPLDTPVATLAWLGAVNEVVLHWLTAAGPPDLAATVPALSRLLLRSIGAPHSA